MRTPSTLRKILARYLALRCWRINLGAATLAAVMATSALAQFPAVFELSSLDGSNGFVINGIDADDRGGASVSSAGDVNGDGVDDLIVGAFLADPNGRESAGESYVVFGRASSSGVSGFGASLDLAALDGSNGFKLDGVDPGDQSGRPVSAAGDVNGDGVADIIVGARHSDGVGDFQAGEAYVVFGKNVAVEGDFSAAIPLGGLDGTNGFILRGSQFIDRVGSSVSGAGDVNGDGFDDVIIGAPSAEPGGVDQAGKSYVVFGRHTAIEGEFAAVMALDDLDGADGFVLNGADAFGRSGGSVGGAGDFNGDGVDDLIIGADGAGSGGKSYLVFGKDSEVDGAFPATFDLGAINGSNGHVLVGVDGGDFSGASVSAAGDVNDDGVNDVIVGAPNATPTDGEVSAGESYVVFGRDVAIDGAFPAISLLRFLDGTNGFILAGEDSIEQSGVSVSGAGDVNGDGIDDIIVGTNDFTGSNQAHAGDSYVVFGKSPSIDGGFQRSIELASLDGTDGFRINGFKPGIGYGSSVSGAGDINGDGIDDLFIGAPGVDRVSDRDVGEAYVIFGRRAIPEPAAALLAAPGLLAGLTRRRR